MPAGELTVVFRDDRQTKDYTPTLRSDNGPVSLVPGAQTYAIASTMAFRTLRSYDFKDFNGNAFKLGGSQLTDVEPKLWRDANVEPRRDTITLTIHEGYRNGKNEVWLTASGREVRTGEPLVAWRHSAGESELRDWTEVPLGTVNVTFLNPEGRYVSCDMTHANGDNVVLRGSSQTASFGLVDGENMAELRCDTLDNSFTGSTFVLWITSQAP
jgi:hypothetical protein